MRTIAGILMFFALVNLTGCNSEDGLIAPVNIINVNTDGSYNSVAVTDLLVGEKKVGSLRFSFKQDTITVIFLTDAGLYIRSMHYHIATSLDRIPQINGRADIENFAYTENTRKILLSALTGSPDFKGRLYVAAYARLANGEIISSEKSEATIARTHKLGDPSYFVTTLSIPGQLTNEYYGYCLQGDQHLDASVSHVVNLLPSTSLDTLALKDVIDAPENLDLVNWLLNQKRSTWIRSDNEAATGADIQMAIWKIIERTGNPTGTFIQNKFDPNLVDKIVKDAYLKGRGFRPVCGQKQLIILHKGPLGEINDRGTYNSGAYADPDYQVTGIVKTLECSNDERDCWSSGTKFKSGKGTYFGFYVN